MRSSILTLAAVCLLVGVVSATRVPESWELLGRVENDARVPVLIAVAHGKDASVKLETQCMAVSDPASASYVCHCAPRVRCGPWPPRCWWWSATLLLTVPHSAAGMATTCPRSRLPRSLVRKTPCRP